MAETTEEEIHAAHVGRPTPHNGTIFLMPYHPAWQSDYAAEARRIHDLLGNTVLLLEHVGSTSVPGLSAKPTMDIVLVVADSSMEETDVTPPEANGYVLRIRQPDWFEHR